MGIYFRSVPQSFEGIWPSLWQFRTLGIGMAHPFLDPRAFCLGRSRTSFWFLCVYDGIAITLRDFHDAGNQGNKLGRAKQETK